MATVLDIGILNFFKPAFTLIFVWIIMFAILEKTNILGDNKGVNSLLAFIVALLFMLTPGLSDVINIITPWFFVLFFMIIFFVIIFMMVGVQEETIEAQFREGWLIWLIAIIVVVGIFGYATSQVFGPTIQGIQGTTETQDESFVKGQLGQILFHPRILGMLFILIVASQTVRLLTQKG